MPLARGRSSNYDSKIDAASALALVMSGALFIARVIFS
jgi:hypothetical protein